MIIVKRKNDFFFDHKEDKFLMSTYCSNRVWNSSSTRTVNGGAMRDRTADLLRARQALSQLSYSPRSRFKVITKQCNLDKVFCFHQGKFKRRIVHYASLDLTQRKAKLVGLGRFELPTSPLSGVRSNQLSYRPINR